MSEAARLALVVGVTRVGLGIAGVVAAAAAGASRSTAVLAAGLGLVLTTFTLAAPGRRQRPAVFPRPRVEASSFPRALAIAFYPSTYGVALLTAIAVFVDAVLAAFLAGVLLGLGVVALIGAATA